MKRFHFALEHVLSFRRRQLEFEEAKLEALASERSALDAESSRLEGEAAETRRSLMVTGSASSQDLVAADREQENLASELYLARWKR